MSLPLHTRFACSTPKAFPEPMHAAGERGGVSSRAVPLPAFRVELKRAPPQCASILNIRSEIHSRQATIPLHPSVVRPDLHELRPCLREQQWDS